MGRCAAGPEIAKVLIDHSWPSAMGEQRWYCWHADLCPTPMRRSSPHNSANHWRLGSAPGFVERYRLSNEIVRAHLLCGAQRRTEITQFIIDLVRFFDSLSNFFAEQRAIAFAQ